MKENKKVDDLTQEQMQMIEDFCRKIGLEDIDLDEKIALNSIFSEEYNRYASNLINEGYPYVTLRGGNSYATEQGLLSIVSLYILKRALISVSNQETLIEQNQQIIELLTKISEK